MSVCTPIQAHAHKHAQTHRLCAHTNFISQPTLFLIHTVRHTYTLLPWYILSELFVWTVSHIAKYGKVGKITLKGSATSFMTQAVPSAPDLAVWDHLVLVYTIYTVTMLVRKTKTNKDHDNWYDMINLKDTVRSRSYIINSLVMKLWVS